MQNRIRKPIPKHAYSFSAAILLAMVSTTNFLTNGNPNVTDITALATLGFIVHGLYDLHKENRLYKAFSPLLSFFQPAETPIQTSATQHIDALRH